MRTAGSSEDTQRQQRFESGAGVQVQRKSGVAAKPPTWPERALKIVYANRRKTATGAAAVLALFLGYHVIFGNNGLAVLDQKRQLSRSLETQLKDMKSENDRMQQHVDLLTNDPNAIEHQAREELHYTRPGEVIYTLPPPPAQPANPNPKPARK